jgi:hypothetical protein
MALVRAEDDAFFPGGTGGDSTGVTFVVKELVCAIVCAVGRMLSKETRTFPPAERPEFVRGSSVFSFFPLDGIGAAVVAGTGRATPESSLSVVSLTSPSTGVTTAGRWGRRLLAFPSAVPLPTQAVQ